LKRAEQVAAVRHVVRRYKPYELAGFIVVIGGLAGWIVLRRRRKKAA
jgi:cellulose synthase operon protein C